VISRPLGSKTLVLRFEQIIRVAEKLELGMRSWRTYIRLECSIGMRMNSCEELEGLLEFCVGEVEKGG